MSNVEILDQQQQQPEEVIAESWSWQSLLSPIVIVSIALHGLVLLLPFGGGMGNHTPAKKPPSAPPKQDKIKLTELATGAIPPPNPSTAAKPSVTSAPSPTPATTASAKASPKPSSSSSPSPSPSGSASKSPSPSLSPKAIPSVSPKPSPSNSAKPSNSPSVTPSKSPSATPSNKPSVSPSPSPSASSPSASPVAPFTDLGYPGAVKGSWGIAALANSAVQTPDKASKVKAYYQGNLTSRGYTAAAPTVTGNRTVYEVKKGNETRYLTLLETTKGTVIALGPDRLPDNLEGASTASAEETAFEAGKSQLQSTTKPIESTLADSKLDPAAFYKEPDQGVLHDAIDFLGLAQGQNPEAVGASLKAMFSGFEVAPDNPYGSSMVFKVSKGNFAQYVSLVAAKDGSGTVVAIWRVKPG
jgi:hypothetical protein